MSLSLKISIAIALMLEFYRAWRHNRLQMAHARSQEGHRT